MQRAEEQGAEHQHIEGALREFGALGHSNRKVSRIAGYVKTAYIQTSLIMPAA